MKSRLARLVFVVLCLRLLVLAQEPASNSTSASASTVSGVPHLIRFSGVVKGLEIKPSTPLGITFLLYKDEQGGAPLWMETQNVQPDSNGHYSAQLGSTQPDGVPVELFSSGEARWLGVQAQGQVEQPRVLLLSVPYALKAADAETLGGKPLSAFQLAAPPSQKTSTASGGNGQPFGEQPNEIRCTGKTGCKAGFIPQFATNGGSATVSNSIISQSGTNINVAGGVTATKMTASGEISVNSGSSLNPILSQASAANAAAIVGFSTGTGLTDGVLGSTLSSGQGTSGVIGLDQNSNGTPGNYTTGVTGVTQNPFGVGVLGYGVLSGNAKADIGQNRAGVWGDDSTGVGVVATSDSGSAAIAVNTSSTFATLVTQNNSTANALVAVNTGTASPTLLAQNTYNVADGHGLIFRAEAPNVNINGVTAACQVNTRGDMGCSGDVVQTRPANGLVKALIYFDPFQSQAIVRCYNSTLAEPAASTPPCGFTYVHTGTGFNTIDFGFEVDDRFIQGTVVYVTGDASNVGLQLSSISTSTGIGVSTFYTNYSFVDSFTDTPFHLTVF